MMMMMMMSSKVKKLMLKAVRDFFVPHVNYPE